MKIFRYGNPSASTVLIQPIDDHDLGELKTEINEIRKQVQIDFQLIAVKVDDWNHDLSPWKAPAVFGKDGFGDGGGGVCCGSSWRNVQIAAKRTISEGIPWRGYFLCGQLIRQTYLQESRQLPPQSGFRISCSI